jgi:transcriptional regulator with XRE-family HTH domain
MADMGRPCPDSLASLGRKVGLHRTILWDWCTGRRYPKLVTAERLATALRIPLERVVYACRRAQERRAAQLAVEQARLEAERR